MGAIAAAIAGAAVVGAGASIGGALLAEGDTPGAKNLGAPELDTSAGMKIAEFHNLINQGIYDPSYLMQASPISILMGEMMSTGLYGAIPKANMTHNLRLAMDWYRAGKPQPTRGKGKDGVSDFPGVTFNKDVPEFKGQPIEALSGLLDHMLALSAYGTLDELIGAESDYTQQIQPLLADSKKAAQGNFKSILDVNEQVRTLLGNLPDASAGGIQKLRGEEKARLLRDMNMSVDEQRGDLLEVANAGNFNPGRPLGDLEEFRARSTQDADLEALSRALALIGGQQGVSQNNLNTLYGAENQRFNIASSIAAADQGLRGGQMLQMPTLEANNAVANGIAAAGNTLASGISGGAQAYQQNKQFDAWLATQ